MAHYQLKYDLHLPADKPWRTNPENKKRIAVAPDPVTLWRNAILDMSEMMRLNEARMTAGLIIDLVNHLPLDVREGIAQGIQDGLGLELSVEGYEIRVNLPQKYDTLTKDGVRVRPSGLVVQA